MADAEKVIKALELCASGCDDDGCVYLEEQNNRGGLAVCRCVDLMAQDALELLKSQTQIVHCQEDIEILKKLMDRAKNRELGVDSINYYYALKHAMEEIEKKTDD